MGTPWRRAAQSASMANWLLELSSRPDFKTALPLLTTAGMFCKLGGTKSGRSGAPLVGAIGTVLGGAAGLGGSSTLAVFPSGSNG
ncbi:MAG TPA: hypothetical protein VNX28_16925 [Gemmataceae bacterium]|nr:hypothetical protein [Gemmataceae bacterium]